MRVQTDGIGNGGCGAGPQVVGSPTATGLDNRGGVKGIKAGPKGLGPGGGAEPQVIGSPTATGLDDRGEFGGFKAGPKVLGPGGPRL